MATRRTARPPFSFPELEPFEPRGRRAILRSPEEVQAEAALLAGRRAPAADEATRSARDQSTVRPNDRTEHRTFDRMVHQPPGQRKKVRHSFDVYADQLLALADIQATVFRALGQKPKIGDLVQDALDAYIERPPASTERPDVRPFDRTTAISSPDRRSRV